MKLPLRHHASLTVCITVLAWSPAAQAQVDWTHYSTNAVLWAFDEAWSESGIWSPTVIRAEGDTLKA